VEDHDREVLDNPGKEIIDKGGEIFFAVSGDEVLGTVVIIPMNGNNVELAKMAVSPGSRGLGISDKLMRACIERAKRDGRDSIILESNTKQAAAIHLYRKFGFVEIPLDPNSEFKRANIRMQLVLG
jgi:ribosomal protein S18 acetylase RimI-like enzyme